MKPAPFQYLAPPNLVGVLSALDKYDGDAKILAGGQSLGPLLNLRLSTPAILVDVNRVPDVARDIERTPSGVRIGALVRQTDAINSALLAERFPIMPEALRCVAHHTIRNRGTVGGSLAHADPAAELPAVSVALGAHFEVASRFGTRVVPAEDFFEGHFTTVLQPNEMLVAVEIPKAPLFGFGCAWAEFAPRSGDFALAGAAVTVHVDPDRTVLAARIVCSGVSGVPLQMADAAEQLVGQNADEVSWDDIGRAAAADVNAAADLLATRQYRRQLVTVVVAQAGQAAVERGKTSR